MRRFFQFLLILGLGFGVYSGLGYMGYHSYWIPIQSTAGSETDEDKNITVKNPKKLIDQERFRKAETVIRKKLSEAEKSTRKSNLQYLLGFAYSRLGQKKDARKAFQTYLDNNPDGSKVANCYFHLGKLSEDRSKKADYFEKAAFRDPQGNVGKMVAGAYSSVLSSDPAPDRQLLHLSLQLIHTTKPGDKKRKKLVEQAKPVSKKVFRSGRMFYDAEKYTIQAGDSLAEIANRYNIGPGWINYTNNRPLPIVGNRKASKIIRGQDLIIYPGQLISEVSVSETRMYLFYRDLVLVKTYPVGIGHPEESPTPRGTFRVIDKVVNPSWTPPGETQPIPYGDEDNILGTRWMEFGGEKGDGYGVHGTTEPDTIGKQVSGGCIRMYNDDVEKLYDLFPMPNSSIPEDRYPTVRITE